MGEDKEVDIVKICDIVSWHTNIFKKEIDMSKDKKIKLDMMDISKLVCSDVIIEGRYSKEICIKLKDLLPNKRIDTSIGAYSNGEKFLILGKLEIPVKEATYIGNENENFLDILKDRKLYDKETKYLLCPKCRLYRVKFVISADKECNKKWWCKNCNSFISYIDYNIVLSDRDKYQIYKLWGIDALIMLTHESMDKTISFIASYFKSSCVAKKDKCLYFDFFKEKDNETIV